MKLDFLNSRKIAGSVAAAPHHLQGPERREPCGPGHCRNRCDNSGFAP